MMELRGVAPWSAQGPPDQNAFLRARCASSSQHAQRAESRRVGGCLRDRCLRTRLVDNARHEVQPLLSERCNGLEARPLVRLGDLVTAQPQRHLQRMRHR